MPTAKGATVRGTLAYVRSLLGEESLTRLLERCDRDTATLLRRVQATDDVPYQALVSLWSVVDDAIRHEHPQWAEAAGAYSIESAGVQLYGGILRKPTPSDFLTQSVSLFRLFYAPGDMTVVQEGSSTAVLRLVDFDPQTTVFCRRQVGGLTRALELAGGEAPRVHHVRCTLSGDAFCEWEMSWANTRANTES